MTRFSQSHTAALDTAIVVSTAAIFAADIFSRLGIAIWVFYLVPLGLSIFVLRKNIPLIIAAVASLLILLGYYISPPGIYKDIAQINRTIGTICIWIMAGVIHQSIHNKLLVKQQEWLQNGQMLLGEKIRGEQSMHQLSDNLLKYIAEYLDAYSGAFYVEADGAYHCEAFYALLSGANIRESFTLGDGLLGQAVKDNRIFYVHDVPEGYLTIGSSLGQSKPRHLLIAPMTADGEVNAVLELAILRRSHNSDLTFLERIQEAVGIAVRSAKVRIELQHLLEQTQQQAEELQTQGEELRVSNEELEEQSLALRESHQRMELQQAELEQVNAQLEEQTRLLETQRNDLQRQARELERVSRYKSEFLANMSHELRTPLNSSLILAKLLSDNREENLTSEQIRYAQTIYASGNDLLRLINDILDLSKIEAGRMDIHPENVRITRLCESLMQTFEPVASQKGLKLQLDIQTGTPETIESDPQRLEQILKNILSNAIKFTDSGSVSFVIAPAGGDVEFRVIDTGIGIAEHQQRMIFEAFIQADSADNRMYGGSGLGLSISRELARLLGGKIRLESSTGEGSTFIVTMPLQYRGAAVQPEKRVPFYQIPDLPVPVIDPTQAGEEKDRLLFPEIELDRNVDDDRDLLDISKRSVLVIEDDVTFASILFDLAHELGFQCLIETTAEAGLNAAIRYLPSAVLLDIGLTDYSGLSVLDRLKRDQRTRHIPVHVVSGSDYTQTVLELGAVGFMLKPVKRDELVQAFERLELRLDQKMHRVLIVEDDLVQYESLRDLLHTANVETVGASSAKECLVQLHTTTFDCMVLDLSLPDKSGFSLLETLSREDAYSFPPVIVYTGKDLSQDEEQNLRKYAKSIIIKGVKSPERLLDEVTLFLHQIISDLPAAHQKMLQKSRDRDVVLEGKRILIVEDDVRNIFALTSILEPRGVIVEIARNGREALNALAASQTVSSTGISLVLMDIMMPEMDGLTAIREIRKNSAWKKLPIIALTAKAMPNDQHECLSAGANDYMAKPLDVEKMMSLVRVWMSR